MPRDGCLNLIELIDQAQLECCLAVKVVKCALKISQDECPSRPKLKYLLDTEVNRYYQIKVTGQLISSDGLCFFVESKEECPETLQHRQTTPELTTDDNFCLNFKFKAITPRTFVGVRFTSQAENHAELTRFEICPTQVLLPKTYYPLIIPICQNDIGQGDKLILCQPGHYELTEDVTFCCKIAILIDACHVRLDLKNHSITSQSAQTTDAILVNKAGCQLQDITIENGQINCPGGSGLNLIKVKGATITQLIVNKAKDHGFRFQSCQKIKVTDCQACDNQEAGFGAGYYSTGAPGSEDIQYHQCSASGNLDGFFVKQPDDSQPNDPQPNERFTYKSCQATKNRRHGFNLKGTLHLVQECDSNQNEQNGVMVDNYDNLVASSRSRNNRGTGFIDLNASNNKWFNNYASVGNAGVAYDNIIFVNLFDVPAPTYWQNVINTPVII